MPRRDDDVDDWPLVVPKPLGAVFQLVQSDPPAVVELWIPDPGSRSGFALYRVEPPEPARRPFGFQAPGSRRVG